MIHANQIPLLSYFFCHRFHLSFLSSYSHLPQISSTLTGVEINHDGEHSRTASRVSQSSQKGGCQTEKPCAFFLFFTLSSSQNRDPLLTFERFRLNLKNIDNSIFNIQCGQYLWEVPGSILASNSDLLRFGFARSRRFQV